jgi:ribosomal protein S18 acetylase RimI-like enzyme
MTDLAGVTSRPALAFSTTALAEITTASFEGCLVPLGVTAETFDARFRRENLDRAASRVLMDGDRPVAIALVARRGWTARVAAMGVVRADRGRGLGAHVLQEVVADLRRSAVRRLLLEVISTNQLAVRLYRRLGFRVRRTLVGYRRPAQSDRPWPADLAEADPAHVARRVAVHGEADLPWTMAAETMAAAVQPARGYALADEAFALVEPARTGGVVLRTLVVTRQARGRGCGRRMFEALAGGHPGQDLLVAADTPEDLVSGFLARTGFERTAIAQFEMELDLTSAADATPDESKERS